MNEHLRSFACALKRCCLRRKYLKLDGDTFSLAVAAAPMGNGVERQKLEREPDWLRRQVVNLRTALRFARDARAETLIKAFISAAEERLIALELATPKTKAALREKTELD
jgi:hypothetical protein